MLTATLVVEPYSTTLVIDHGRTKTRLNVIWVDRTAEERAEELLTQNGYRRLAPWIDGSTTVKAGPEATACSCWQELRDGERVVVRIGFGCRDHAAGRLEEYRRMIEKLGDGGED